MIKRLLFFSMFIFYIIFCTIFTNAITKDEGIRTILYILGPLCIYDLALLITILLLSLFTQIFIFIIKGRQKDGLFWVVIDFIFSTGPDRLWKWVNTEKKIVASNKIEKIDTSWKQFLPEAEKAAHPDWNDLLKDKQ